MVMAVCLVPVNGKHGAKTDQLQALAQDVGQGNVVRPVVIGIQRQYAAGQSIHHILAGSFHDNVADKAGRKAAIGGEEFGEGF